MTVGKPKPPEKAIETKDSLILIVDDELLNRELLKDLLAYQYQTVAVSRGQQALDYLAENDCDLILLDLMMPEMNGYAVLEKIRETKGTTELPVIILSALAQPKDIAKGLEFGANDYVTKPISPRVIRARIETQLSLKHLSDERSQHIDELLESEKMRTRLTQIASHDLKNPLNNLRLIHTLLNELLQDDEKITQLLDSLRMNVDTMHQVIDTFLDLIAIRTNNLELKSDTFSLRDVVINVVSQYQISATSKNILLTYRNLSGYVCGDQGRMVQAVSNLVSNAIKYSPKGTTITVWCEIVEDRQRVCVQDEGPGIPEEERSLLFQEFSKLSPRPTDGEDSTGLGLWIVKTLMQKQGGDVGAYFPEKGGSVFWTALPTCEPPTASE